MIVEYFDKQKQRFFDNGLLKDCAKAGESFYKISCKFPWEIERIILDTNREKFASRCTIESVFEGIDENRKLDIHVAAKEYYDNEIAYFVRMAVHEAIKKLRETYYE